MMVKEVGEMGSGQSSCQVSCGGMLRGAEASMEARPKGEECYQQR